ncbi:MAG: 16S rRNA (adenine(1518)-N(6)/adenine(1519)-N(6))-dimethyltransferase RsmA [bacterium]|nr:16S rRNA (adenine(1518)-N(6)/adenine(1519)-N(6))-dimethyltransferase RsmA [bacterium]
MSNLKQLLIKSGIKPNKSSGQNFLIDENMLKLIADAAALRGDETVLEIGAGPGNLTKYLADKSGRVIAVEPDRTMGKIFGRALTGKKNVELIQSDILRWWDESRKNFANGSFIVVANIPYNLTSRLFRIFLSESPKPDRLIFLVQEEVADRVCAKPGEMSLLSVSVRYYGHPEKLFTVPRTAFWPSPEVDSAVVSVSTIVNNAEMDEEFFRFVRIGFSARRKQLHNNLKSGFPELHSRVMGAFQSSGFSPNIRPQELAVDDWKTLFFNFQKAKKPL